MTLIISQLGLKPRALRGETVIVTGAGSGIGYQAARALMWLGANVVIAEVNYQNGLKAAETLAKEFNCDRVLFVHTNVGDEIDVLKLYKRSVDYFGKVDVIINNATIAVLGQVKDLPIEDWDRSYRVNLRGPVLMAKYFLPDMIKRNHGVFACVSSTGTAFLGGYETFKAAQVHLAYTLDAELEGTNVIAYTIGPGLVLTQTACQAIEQVAQYAGIAVDEFLAMNKNVMLSAEEAGAGFAASVVFAEKFRGQEISSMQVLKAADIKYGGNSAENESAEMDADKRQWAKVLSRTVRVTLKTQLEDWKRRSLFERQWVVRDFKKAAGMPIEEWLSLLEWLEDALNSGGTITHPPLEKLASYYEHLAELAKGYEKNPEKLKESLQHVYDWRDEVEKLEEVL